MARTLDDLKHLLTRHGYACELLLDALVATRVPTQTYTNPFGEHALEIYLSFDRPNHCVAVEVLHAFDLRAADSSRASDHSRAADHARVDRRRAPPREAALACLLAAIGRTPLVRPSLEPEGTIRIRIDCPCDDTGVSDDRVLEALAVLTAFVEAWHPQMTAAMQTGRFNPGDVAHLNLSRMPPHNPLHQPAGIHQNH